jgi:O-methyltransferase
MKRILANVIYSRAVAERFDDRARERIRRQGGAWPRMAHTMIGFKRLSNLQFCVEDVIARGVPGDLIETGVWRGGACILMRAILKAHGVVDRQVWVADSFEGLPRPSADKYPADAGVRLHTAKALAVSVEEVKANFKEYGLLDDQVRFLKGWFRDSLPAAPIKRLAVLRLDGDMYESTMDALVNLYPRLAAGGYLIVDDYGAVPSCREAIEDFRREHGITEAIREIDWSGVYWQRAGEKAAEPLAGPTN